MTNGAKWTLVMGIALASWVPAVVAQRGGAGVAPTYGPTPGIKPPKELSDAMKANNAILGVDGRGGNVAGKLGADIRNDDFDAIVGDANALKPNFDAILTYFTEQKMADAVSLAKVGVKALADLEAGAKARNKHAVEQAQIDLATACRNCHLARRVMILRVPMEYEISRN